MLYVSNGVPQGSILGPLCFNLFINDLPLSVKANTVLFADDAAFVLKSPSMADLYCKITQLLGDLTTYLNNNRLVANSSKSKLMIFSSHPVQELPNFTFGNEIIEWVDEFKYLGLTITNKLSFAKHINKVAMNISRITGVFQNLRSIIPLQILIKLYYALAYPHLINHIVIWGSSPLSHTRVLSVRINNLLRIILGIRWTNGRPDMHTNEMYKMNRILRLEDIFKYCLFKLLKELLEGRRPDMFRVLLEPNISGRTYNTRNGIFRHPALSCEVERRFLPHQLIILYESIPAGLLGQNFNIAAKNFKKYLLDRQ